MTPADILERLVTYELEFEEKRDVNGTRRKSHALKAKASRHSSPEPSSASGVESDDPSGIGKDLTLIVKRFNRFQRRSSSSPKKSYSSRHSSSSTHRHPQETLLLKTIAATSARNQAITLLIALCGKLTTSRNIHTETPQDDITNPPKS